MHVSGGHLDLTQLNSIQFSSLRRGRPLRLISVALPPFFYSLLYPTLSLFQFFRLPSPPHHADGLSRVSLHFRSIFFSFSAFYLALFFSLSLFPYHHHSLFLFFIPFFYDNFILLINISIRLFFLLFLSCHFPFFFFLPSPSSISLFTPFTQSLLSVYFLSLPFTYFSLFLIRVFLHTIFIYTNSFAFHFVNTYLSPPSVSPIFILFFSVSYSSLLFPYSCFLNPIPFILSVPIVP